MEKETIELVKKMIEDGNLSQEIAEKYCPELGESEDERIKKAIINFLHEGNPFKNIKKETRQRWIDWLEKQGRLMKALQISNAKIGELVEEKYNLEEKLKKQGNINPTEDELEALRIAAYEPIKNWSEEDEKRISSILLSIEYCKEQYPNLREYQYDIDWFKSLKERVQPQSEWGEEDERIRIETIELLETANHPNVLHRNGKALDFTENIDWLKSLRPQQNRWKPSDEELYSLKEVMNIVGSKYKSCLNSLYSNLMKLREE